MAKPKLPTKRKQPVKMTPELLVQTAIWKGDNLRRIHETLGTDVMGREGRKAVELLQLMDKHTVDASMASRRIVYGIMGAESVSPSLHNRLMERIIYDLSNERESFRFEEFFDNVLSWMMDEKNNVDPSVIIATVMSILSERVALPEKKAAITQSKRYLDFRDKYRRILKIIEA